MVGLAQTHGWVAAGARKVWTPARTCKIGPEHGEIYIETTT
jgi:hypothetical protein